MLSSSFAVVLSAASYGGSEEGIALLLGGLFYWFHKVGCHAAECKEGRKQGVGTRRSGSGRVGCMSCCEMQRRQGLVCGPWKKWLRKGGLHVML
jgi:hypothetical protein